MRTCRREVWVGVGVGADEAGDAGVGVHYQGVDGFVVTCGCVAWPDCVRWGRSCGG